MLAIPLADDLPTPNARKTCALSIWLIQSQRLPSEVLVLAKDRIAYALRRGIEGELGKEGKKGSANDGLKVRSVVNSPINLFNPYIRVFVGHPRTLNIPTRHVRASIHTSPPFDPIKPPGTNPHSSHPSMSCSRRPSHSPYIPPFVPPNSQYSRPDLRCNCRFPHNSHHSVQILPLPRASDSPHNPYDSPGYRAATCRTGTCMGYDGLSQFDRAAGTEALLQRKSVQSYDWVAEFEHAA